MSPLLLSISFFVFFSFALYVFLLTPSFSPLFLFISLTPFPLCGHSSIFSYPFSLLLSLLFQALFLTFLYCIVLLSPSRYPSLPYIPLISQPSCLTIDIPPTHTHTHTVGWSDFGKFVVGPQF